MRFKKNIPHYFHRNFNGEHYLGGSPLPGASAKGVNFHRVLTINARSLLNGIEFSELPLISPLKFSSGGLDIQYSFTEKGFKLIHMYSDTPDTSEECISVDILPEIRGDFLGIDLKSYGNILVDAFSPGEFKIKSDSSKLVWLNLQASHQGVFIKQCFNSDCVAFNRSIQLISIAYIPISIFEVKHHFPPSLILRFGMCRFCKTIISDDII